MVKVKTHLMFQGNAEKAINFYSSVFSDFHIEKVERDGGSETEEGAFQTANISFAGHELIVYDSPPVHDFTFTPSMSLFVDFDTKEDLESAFSKLSEGGKVMMPLNNYGFSTFYGWTKDVYGVSWQLNLP